MSTESNSINRSRAIVAAVFIALMTIAAVVWQLIAEYWSDDFYYIREITGEDGSLFGLTGMNEITSFGQALESVAKHSTLYNNRMANYLMIMSNLLPPWLVDTVNGLMIGLMIPLIAICAGGGRWAMRSPVMVIVSATMMWGILPWWDNMVSVDYLFNYAWTSALFLITAYYCVYRLDTLTRGQLAALCALALFTAWMHEGFALPMLGMMCVMWLTRRNRRVAVLVIVLGIGAAFSSFGPGTLNRLTADTLNARQQGLEIYMSFISRAGFALTPWLLVFATMAWGALHKGWRVMWDEFKRCWPWMVMGAVSYAMGVILLKVGRVFWVMDLCAIVMTLRLLCLGVSIKPRVKYVIAGILGATCLAFMVNLCYWQDYYAKEQREMIEMSLSSPDRVIYIRDPLNTGAPWTTLGIIHRYNGWDLIANYNLSMWLRKDDNLDLYPILRSNMRGGFYSLPKIPGDNNLRGEYPCIYAPDSTLLRLKINIGKPLASMHPADYIIYLMRGLPDYYYVYCSKPLKLHVGDSVLYQHRISTLPRSVSQRELVSIEATSY